MKKTRFFLLALIVAFTACNSDDDIYTEPENELKIVNGPIVDIPVPTGYYYDPTPFPELYEFRIYNHYDLSEKEHKLTWKQNPTLNSSGFYTKIIQTSNEFNSTFNNPKSIFIDFNKCTLIATRFSYPNYISEGASSRLTKYFIYRYNGTFMIDIRVKYQQIESPALSTPTVLLVVPKQQFLGYPYPTGYPLQTRILR